MFRRSTVKLLKVYLRDNKLLIQSMQCTETQERNSYHKLKMLLCMLDNYVDGQALFQLTEEDLCDMIQPIGVVKNVMCLILGDQVIDYQSVYL